MNKCEWKDILANGELNKNRNMIKRFYPCDNFTGQVFYKDSVERVRSVSCFHCHADILKPESENPLIVKSGETWVAHFKGVDYFCIRPELLIYISHKYNLLDTGVWKPFSEIELTDEIAKLRPMVKVRNHINNCWLQIKLVYVSNKDYYTESGSTWIYCRLATPQELQEADNA